MFFLSIDIGKQHLKGELIAQHRNLIGKTIRISTTESSSEHHLVFFNKHSSLLENTLIEMKPILSIYTFAHKIYFHTTF